MIGVVVAAHGNMAEALVASAQGILGPMVYVRAVNVLPGEGLEIGRGKVAEAIREVDEGDGVLVLADLFGGTPCNCGLLNLAPDCKLEVITGVNLPMLLKVPALREHALHDAADELKAVGQKAITLASDLMRARQQAASAASART